MSGRLLSMPSPHNLRIRTIVLLLASGCLALFSEIRTAGFKLTSRPQPSGSPVAALSPFVDVHTHLEAADLEGSIKAALRTMPDENAAKLFLMPPPFAPQDPAPYDADLLLPAIKGHEDKLAVLGGGGTLNPMIQEAVRSGDSGPGVRRRFKEKAEELLRSGVVGFGEMAAEHFAGGTAYQSASPDHPLFLLLADIAAAHGVPIDLHMEAIPNAMDLPPELSSPPNPEKLQPNIAAFERLLKHNPHARIIWAHAGTDYTGYRTPDLCRKLLAAHPNLYMELKIDPVKPGKNSPLASGGSIKPAWLQLLKEFPDRFLVGSDQHYPAPASSAQRWRSVVILLNQLPPELRQKIAIENPARLYPEHGPSR